MKKTMKHHNTFWNRWAPTFGNYGVALVVILLIGAFLVWPIGVILSKAFVSPDGGFTLEYFYLLFASDLQTQAIKNSLWIGFWTTVLTTCVSFPLAVIHSRWDFRGKTILSSLLLLPMIMPPFVGAMGLQRFFARFGTVNIFLLERGWIETPIEWFSQSHMLFAVVILEVLHLYPIMYLNLSAALANVDPSLEEMAATLGASRWRRLRTIVWPLARPGFFAGASIIFIWALTDLGTPLLVDYHEVMPVRIFNMVTDAQENPMGFALVCFVILLTVGFFLLSKVAFSPKKYMMMAKGHVTSPIKPAGPLRTLWFYALFGFVILLAILPHISVIITSLGENWFMTALPETYSLKYYGMIFEQDLSLVGIKNSLLFSSLSTMMDAILGLLVAFIVVRKKIPMSWLLDGLVMIPLALPGIVLAFSYVMTYSDTILDPLDNPVPLLVIAYGIRRLPYMVRAASAGLEQMSPSLEEASALFGASGLRTMVKITLPLVTANLVAGGLLCFSYAMLDVSDSMILAMKDRFYPMTKAIYTLYLEQGSGEFVASALGVVAMGILGACIFGASSLLGKKMGELFRS
jgi:iron(III) transport system permease protein